MEGDAVPRTLRECRQSSNLVVNNARLNQLLKVMAPEARAGWDITINPWPLAQWCRCLWVPAWNACDLSVCKAHCFWTPFCEWVVYVVFLLISGLLLCCLKVRPEDLFIFLLNVYTSNQYINDGEKFASKALQMHTIWSTRIKPSEYILIISTQFIKFRSRIR